MIRFYVKNGEFKLSKGSSRLDKIQVMRNSMDGNDYRIILAGDQTNFIDINAKLWSDDILYVNIFPKLSPLLVQDATGVLGKNLPKTAGGLVDVAAVQKLFITRLEDSHFGCTDARSCITHLKSPENYFAAGTDSQSQQFTAQGYGPVPEAAIPTGAVSLLGFDYIKGQLDAFTPAKPVDTEAAIPTGDVLLQIDQIKAQLAAAKTVDPVSEYKLKVQQLCRMVLLSAPECAVMIDVTRYIKDCITDNTLSQTGNFQNIENMKQHYLSQCRAIIDSSLEAIDKSGKIAEMRIKLRAKYGFGDGNCGICFNGGTCNLWGCACKPGFSGRLCNIQLK